MDTTPARVMGYDLARALAVFGMVVVNFKVVMGGEGSGPEWLRRLLGLLDGRAAATFVVLAGVGVSLLTRRSRESGDRAAMMRDRGTLLRRGLFLFVVGLAYTPVWSADILHFYAVYIAGAAFLLASSRRRLLGGAVGLVLLFVVLLAVWDYGAGWDWEVLSYSGFWTPRGMLRNLFFNGFHPVIPWLAFLLLGMVLGRSDMTDSQVRQRVLRWSVSGMVLGEGGGWVLGRVVQAANLPESGAADLLAVVGTSPMPPTPLYMLAGSATAVTVIVLCIALAERQRDSAWLGWLVATGQVALTLYVAHVVIGMGILEAAGRLEDQTLSFSLLAAVVFCTGSVVFARTWRSRFPRGPLEWIMRRMTDPRRKP